MQRCVCGTYASAMMYALEGRPLMLSQAREFAMQGIEYDNLFDSHFGQVWDLQLSDARTEKAVVTSKIIKRRDERNRIALLTFLYTLIVSLIMEGFECLEAAIFLCLLYEWWSGRLIPGWPTPPTLHSSIRLVACWAPCVQHMKRSRGGGGGNSEFHKTRHLRQSENIIAADVHATWGALKTFGVFIRQEIGPAPLGSSSSYFTSYSENRSYLKRLPGMTEEPLVEARGKFFAVHIGRLLGSDQVLQFTPLQVGWVVVCSRAEMKIAGRGAAIGVLEGEGGVPFHQHLRNGLMFALEFSNGMVVAWFDSNRLASLAVSTRQKKWWRAGRLVPASILLDEDEHKSAVAKAKGKDVHDAFWPPKQGFGELGNVWGSELAFAVGLAQAQAAGLAQAAGQEGVDRWPWCIVGDDTHRHMIEALRRYFPASESASSSATATQLVIKGIYQKALKWDPRIICPRERRAFRRQLRVYGSNNCLSRFRKHCSTKQWIVLCKGATSSTALLSQLTKAGWKPPTPKQCLSEATDIRVGTWETRGHARAIHLTVVGSTYMRCMPLAKRYAIAQAPSSPGRFRKRKANNFGARQPGDTSIYVIDDKLYEAKGRVPKTTPAILWLGEA